MLRRLTLSWRSLTAFSRPLATAPRVPDAPAAPSSPSTTPSRWRRLRRERRAAPTPANRVAYAFDRDASHDLRAALQHVRAAAWARFDESVDLAFRLNVDPRQATHNLRGSVALPHGSGRASRVIAFAEGTEADAARAAGADLVGAEELVERIAAKGGAKVVKGFAACVAEKTLMPKVAAGAGRVLGPKGLMPSVKEGTVGVDVADLVTKMKRGVVRYRVDRTGNLHFLVGKLSFEDDHLEGNVAEVVREVLGVRPASLKGGYVNRVVISSSMGPPVQLDMSSLARLALS